jgi:hypothetical protein
MHLFTKLFGHNKDIIVSHALQTSIFFISLSVIIILVSGIINFLNNKYFANQISKILYQVGHSIVEDSKSCLDTPTFVHQGSHSGKEIVKESSHTFSIEVIIRVSKYFDLAKFFIATIK